ncbi:MAG: PHB depolymerase family esterase [Pseudoxanthomonas sp.]
MKFLDDLLARFKAPAYRDRAAPALDARVGKTINDALASAGLARDAGLQHPVAGIIDDALTQAGLMRTPLPEEAVAPGPASPSPSVAATRSAAGVRKKRAPATVVADREAGEFVSRSFATDTGTHTYKLYFPSGYSAQSAHLFPLLIMLHGCTQSPDDFAAGTRMNTLADQQGVLVAYPAQSATANASRCWNWFRRQDQSRDEGEPALLAGITRQIVASHRVDPDRVYVAGLSAGAAMAVILGRTYPELYAAVGAHSGLPYAAAHDVGSAFTAMKGGSFAAARDGAVRSPPTIVFHGDGDHTVKPSNSESIAAQVAGSNGESPALHSSDEGTASGGRRYTRLVYHDAAGKPLVEQWRVHGGGHAWMGGSTNGTYTDPRGPDASAEMLRFFLQQAS